MLNDYDIEKLLSRLPKPKLNITADFKIKFKLYWLIIAKDFSAWCGALKFYVTLKPLFVSLVIVALIFSGTSLYAYTSSQITPVSKLYALKRAVEKVEQGTALTIGLKVKVYEKFSQRRLEEALHLSQEHLPTATSQEQKVSGIIQNNLTEAINDMTSAFLATQQLPKNQQEKNYNEEIKAKERTANYLSEIEKSARTVGDEDLAKKVRQAKSVLDLKEQEDEKEGLSADEIMSPEGKPNQNNADVKVKGKAESIKIDKANEESLKPEEKIKENNDDQAQEIAADNNKESDSRQQTNEENQQQQAQTTENDHSRSREKTGNNFKASE